MLVDTMTVRTEPIWALTGLLRSLAEEALPERTSLTRSKSRGPERVRVAPPLLSWMELLQAVSRPRAGLCDDGSYRKTGRMYQGG